MRVLVTRPEPQAARTARRLAARGYDPVVAPLLVFRALADAAVPEGPHTAVLLTSQNAVRALCGHRHGARVTALPAFCVGEATADAARAAGFPSVESAAGNARDLARLVRARVSPAADPTVHAGGGRPPDADAEPPAADGAPPAAHDGPPRPDAGPLAADGGLPGADAGPSAAIEGPPATSAGIFAGDAGPRAIPRLLAITGRDKAADIAGELAAAGIPVDEVALYAMEPAMTPPETLTRAAAPGERVALTFYSPRTAATFAALLHDDPRLAWLRGMPAVCLSEAVARPVREAGLAHVAVAARPEEGALLDCLDALRNAADPD